MDRSELDHIKAWYAGHGVPFEPEDWGERDPSGESLGRQHQKPEQDPHKRSVFRLPEWYDGRTALWPQRTHEERMLHRELEAFFEPYLGLLPRAKGNLIRMVYGEQMTLREAGTEEGMVNRGSAHHALQRALQDLLRIIAQDDPDFQPPADRRRRDFEAEREAAERVFVRYHYR